MTEWENLLVKTTELPTCLTRRLLQGSSIVCTMVISYL